MKTVKYLLIPIISFALFSCAIHNGMMTGSAALTNSNFTIIRTVSGSAKAEYFLGFGGLSKEGLIMEARKDLYSKNTLKKGQALANLSVDYKYKFILIYWKTTATITADLVDFNEIPDSTEKKIVEEKKTQVLVQKEELKIIEPDFKLKEKVLILRGGKQYLGNVEVVNSKSIYVSHMLRNGMPTTTKKSLTSVFKTKDTGFRGQNYNYSIGDSVIIYSLDDKIKSTIIALGKQSFLAKLVKPNGKEKIMEFDYSAPGYTVKKK